MRRRVVKATIRLYILADSLDSCKFYLIKRITLDYIIWICNYSFKSVAEGLLQFCLLSLRTADLGGDGGLDTVNDVLHVIKDALNRFLYVVNDVLQRSTHPRGGIGFRYGFVLNT